MLCTSAQSQHYYSFYRTFDSTGVFKEKVVVPFDSTTFRAPAEVRKGPATYLDSLSLEKIDYLANLLENNHKLVITMLHYDDFHVKENHLSYGVNLSYMRAERVLRRILRKGIDPLRIAFYYTTCVTVGYTHEELLSTDNRLEFWIYELPSL